MDLSGILLQDSEYGGITNKFISVIEGIEVKKILFLLMIVTVSESLSDTTTDLAICAAKGSDAERLICYDDLAKKLNVDKPKTKLSAGQGKWKVREEVSPIDDSKKVIMTLDAETTIGHGYREYRPIMYIRCSENKTSLFINTNHYLGLRDIPVLTRLDKDKATTRKWGLSTDNKAIFAPGSNAAYAKSLFNNDSLLIQLTPYNESPVMTTFDIRGLKEAIKPLREACHW